MEVKQVIVVRKDLQMRKGKIAAQTAHAAMKFLLHSHHPGSDTLKRKLTPEMVDWLAAGTTKVVVGCESEEELVELVRRAERLGVIANTIVDAGRTEFHGVPTLTCAAFGPDEVGKLDRLTGHLKLL